MAAEDTRAPRVVRDEMTAFSVHPTLGGKPKPAIERQPPIIHDALGALEATTCTVERFKALFTSALEELNELATGIPAEGGEVTAHFVKRLYENWLIFETVDGFLTDIDRTLVAINEKMYADRREQAA